MIVKNGQKNRKTLKFVEPFFDITHKRVNWENFSNFRMLLTNNAIKTKN